MANYIAKQGEEIMITISQADDGAAAYKDGVSFVKANFMQSTNGLFIMQNQTVSIHLEIWNMSGGWYGAKIALFIGGKHTDQWVIDQGPSLPQTIAWSHDFSISN